ncbi:hypothetical protein M3D92_04355 [Micrococcus terreus]|uniref:helix-turn-helix transcriptional regulator n=1 Tax=Micrococcus terreus TaxID=574650 RepID=UPI0021A909ED|nr:helix-turn-helix domain-containing protein [Micrococcus terreus]MCT2088534.1 hypothetical protein [Micrococcus terreus]
MEASTPNLTKTQVAERYAISLATLDRWHAAGEGPARYTLPGGTVRFSETDLLSWEQARRVKLG